MDDEAKEILSRSLVHQIERLEAERDALREQLAEVREALEPFAALERINWVGTMLEGGKDEDAVFYHHASGTKIMIGDFRRARAVLDKIKGGEDE